MNPQLTHDVGAICHAARRKRNAIRNENVICVCGMKGLFSTREAAKKLGVWLLTLQRHVSAKTVHFPPLQKVGA